MSDQIFNGRTYAENLDFITDASKALFTAGATSQGWAGLIRNQLEAEASSGGSSLNTFLNQFNKNLVVDAQNRPIKQPLPQTWEAFITALRRDFLGQNPPLPPETTANNTFQNMALFFLGISSQSELLLPSSTLIATLNAQGVTVNSKEQFKRAFADFLTNYPYKPNGSVGTSQEFFQNLDEFFGIIAKMSTDGQILDSSGAPITDVITSYEEIFEQFPAPSETRFTNAGTPFLATPTFEERFAEFYKSYVHEHGYFATGRALDEWTRKTQSEYNTGLKGSFAISPSGSQGVGRATTQVALGKIEKNLFNTDIEAAVTGYVQGQPGLGSYAFTIQCDPVALFDITKDKFLIDSKVIQNFSFDELTGFATFTVDIPATMVGIESSTISHIEYALHQIRFSTTSTELGIREFALFPSLGFGVDILRDTVEVSGVTIVNTSVTTDSSARVLVINRLFKLIAEMIDIMQQVTAAQAEYLTFLTQWQKAYTDLISQIKTFSRNDGTVFGFVDSDSATDQVLANKRGEANTASLNMRERLSNLRGVVSDLAKREQSRINQSQDAATQQGQFATSLITQLSTILGAIYR